MLECNQAYYNNEEGKWQNYNAKHPYTRVKLEAVKECKQKGYKKETDKKNVRINMMTDSGSMVTILQKKVTDNMKINSEQMKNATIKIIGVTGAEMPGRLKTTAVKITYIRTGEY